MLSLMSIARRSRAIAGPLGALHRDARLGREQLCRGGRTLRDGAPGTRVADDKNADRAAVAHDRLRVPDDGAAEPPSLRVVRQHLRATEAERDADRPLDLFSLEDPRGLATADQRRRLQAGAVAPGSNSAATSACADARRFAQVAAPKSPASASLAIRATVARSAWCARSRRVEACRSATAATTIVPAPMSQCTDGARVWFCRQEPGRATRPRRRRSARQPPAG